jgi:ABC-type thiamin/hydroxymethylpyrimidine transport system permease subunit
VNYAADKELPQKLLRTLFYTVMTIPYVDEILSALISVIIISCQPVLTNLILLINGLGMGRAYPSSRSQYFEYVTLRLAEFGEAPCSLAVQPYPKQHYHGIEKPVSSPSEELWI